VPDTWDDGVDGALLCHLLFSVHDDLARGAAMRFRCGPVHGQRGTNYCHKHNMPHCRGLRNLALERSELKESKMEEMRQSLRSAGCSTHGST
jgi:hypothetical protein